MTVKLLPSKFLAISAACIWLLGSGSALFAAGGKISGQVVNGTTGSPVANQKLQLLMPRGGMQQVATAVTDASGHFAMASSDLATDSFYLLQATYQDVNYHAPVKFDDRGQAQVDITVYDATRTAPPGADSIRSHHLARGGRQGSRAGDVCAPQLRGSAPHLREF